MSEMKTNYYTKHLSAYRLKKCYEIGSPRIKRYLQAELQFTLSHIQPSDTILELGCGYGRVLSILADKAKLVHGIDTSKNNLALAKAYLKGKKNIKLHLMDAENLQFPGDMFNTVIAIQNGISAFKIIPEILVTEALRVTKNDGLVVLSSYAERFWNERLQWFVDQSNAGLLGEIDWEETKNGVIVCKGGFRATSFYRDDFDKLLVNMNLEGVIQEVDNSSIFCIIKKRE